MYEPQDDVVRCSSAQDTENDALQKAQAHHVLSRVGFDFCCQAGCRNFSCMTELEMTPSVNILRSQVQEIVTFQLERWAAARRFHPVADGGRPAPRGQPHCPASAGFCCQVSSSRNGHILVDARPIVLQDINVSSAHEANGLPHSHEYCRVRSSGPRQGRLTPTGQPRCRRKTRVPQSNRTAGTGYCCPLRQQQLQSRSRGSSADFASLPVPSFRLAFVGLRRSCVVS